MAAAATDTFALEAFPDAFNAHGKISRRDSFWKIVD